MGMFWVKSVARESEFKDYIHTILFLSEYKNCMNLLGPRFLRTFNRKEEIVSCIRKETHPVVIKS